MTTLTKYHNIYYTHVDISYKQASTGGAVSKGSIGTYGSLALCLFILTRRDSHV